MKKKDEIILEIADVNFPNKVLRRREGHREKCCARAEGAGTGVQKTG